MSTRVFEIASRRSGTPSAGSGTVISGVRPFVPVRKGAPVLLRLRARTPRLFRCALRPSRKRQAQADRHRTSTRSGQNEH